MASPELVRIMNAAQTDPQAIEEVQISGFNVPWETQEMPEREVAEHSGGTVLGAPGHTQINANVVKDVERTMGMQPCPKHGMDHGIADPECVA
eukprot:4193442-Amphidinium_carterae.1